ncbi:MAG: OmpA family protein [Bacteroidales bacterium]|jgi:outer membrane protein OmpA-like peptidoglycan-associated protein|nr:OmpA family protein [Bacteroidales bacterium]
MKKIKIYTLAVMTGLLSCTALKAQYKHEFSLYGGGGSSTLKYDVAAGTQKNGFGGQAGLDYAFFFSPKWGLGTGAGLSFHNAGFNEDHLTTSYITVDMDGTPFEFRSTARNYEEKQTTMFLQIPLMLQFQTGNSHRFFVAAGGKVDIPVNAKYKSSTTAIQNSGYYAEEDYEYTTQEFMGFGAFTGRDAGGDLKFKTAFLLTAEAGIKWKLKDDVSLYTGAYLDYGLNNIYRADNNRQFVDYHPDDPRNFMVNSMINSQYIQNGTAQSFTDKVLPVAAGLKVKLAFGKGSAAKVSAYYVPPTVPDNGVEEARRRAEKDAGQKTVAEEVARKAEVDRLAPEKKRQEAQRLAIEKAHREEAARLQIVKADIDQPVENYGLSQTELSPAQKQELDKKIVLLQQNQGLTLYIYGHTCNIGSKETNERIGLARAEKAKEYLLSKGIAESRILRVASKHDTEPLAPNTNEENRQRNRRVGIVVQ